jgi:predicted DNA-binding protein (UPF0251 family)/predicted Fe-Mo cluster-binding NifX family protein
MPRPFQERRVGAEPAFSLFKPEGVPPCGLEIIGLGLDEFEALRLADCEGLYQEAAAIRMGVSRQTFGRIIEEAHRKVATALVEGRGICISGGPATCETQGATCMKLAVPTRDAMVDAHFGHCAYFSVFTVEDGHITAEEKLESPESCGCKSGIAGELARLGVTTLIAGNIGEGAVHVLSSYGIEVLRGATGTARGAVEDYLAGKPLALGANCAEHHEGCEHRTETE